MKITCQSCQAKYTIADEKVLGKIVKIRCKKCSSTIVVNGSDPSGAAVYGDPGASEQGQAGGDEGWTVNVGDGDQRTMTEGEVVAAYQAGVIGAETFCWKDGMGDWLPLREIDALFDQCNATRAVAPSAPEPARGRAAPAPVASAQEYAAASNGSNGGGSAHAAAARRTAGRAPAADLFHGAAQAGGEEEVMTSAPVGAPQAYDDQKPTGARNENSVLFSLSALTSKGGDRPPAVPGAEASGLIDIRQLSAQMGRGDDKKRSRVDDIMNLSSGGAFNGALSAPALTAPAVDQYAPNAGGAAGSRSVAPEKSKAVIFLAIGAAAFVIVAAVGATFMLTHNTADTAAASASAAATDMPPASATMAATAAAPATATATATASAAPTATETAAAAAPAATTASPVAAPTPVAATPRPQTEHAAPVVHAAPVAAAPAAAAENDQPFNMGEAKSRLAAAAAAAQGCKKGDGPVGTGHVVIVFAPSGGAQTATINGPPFDGTPTGACVAARFRGVHVPPFGGSPFSVSKSFTIN